MGQQSEPKAKYSDSRVPQSGRSNPTKWLKSECSWSSVSIWINEDGGSTEFSEAQRDAMLLKLFAPERPERAQKHDFNSTRALFL